MMTLDCVHDALLDGDIPLVTTVLGHYFAISGVVEMGKQLGRQLGFPTANIRLEPGQILPPIGGYATFVWHGDQRYMAATNIGKNPTIGGDRLTVEAHLLDFDGDLYGEVLRVEFVERLGDEHTFSDLDALIAYIKDSVVRTRRILSAHA